MAKKINDMDWKGVKAFHQELNEALKDPENKRTVEALLSEQEHSLEGFEADPAFVVLEYISKEVA